jgi:hypothetical protein
MLALLAPSFIADVAAVGCTSGTCYLQTLTNTPTSDLNIVVRLDNTTFYPLPHLFPFANGTKHSIEVMNVTAKGVSGTRYVWKQWEQCGIQAPSGTNTMLHTPLMIANYTTPCPSQFNGPYTARFDSFPPVGCVTNCILDAKTSVPATDATIWVRLDNTTYFTLPHTFSFPNGTSHSIEVLNITLNGPSGSRYVWKQWTQASSPSQPNAMLRIAFLANYTGSNAWIAQLDKQFQMTLTFADVSGQPVNAPSYLILQNGASSLNLTSYSSLWTSAVVWSVIDAKWEGIKGSVSASQTVDMTTSPGVRSIQLKAYPSTIKVVDTSNSPLVGVTVVVTFSNSTSKTLTTDSQGIAQLGRVPSGNYVAQLTYQNQDMGKWTADASTTPNNTIQVNVGSPATSSQVSAIVLLTIFGIAFFLVLLAIKVRKSPSPPKI